MNPNRKPRITVRLSGGLGNQIFKAMAGVNLAHVTESELILDTTWYSYPRRIDNQVYPRNLELDYFANLGPHLSRSILPPLIHMRTGQIFRRTPKIFRHKIGYILDTDISQIKRLKARTLDGSFEDYDLLPKKECLRQYLSFPNQESSWFRAMANRVQEINPIAMHVRMGDYLNLPEIYGFISTRYYHEALKKVGADSKSPIWIFSDEPDKAKIWLSDLPVKPEYVFVPSSVRPGEVLRLMSLCKSLVIAHSTFSWWAAFLGNLEGTNEIVVMPSRFLSFQHSESSALKVANWIVINV